MMVFWRAGIAFLAVPKTGTHSYQAAYGDSADVIIRGPTGAKHMNARKFNRHMRPALEGKGARRLATIAVIREPIDWLGSWYRYRQRPKLQGHPNSTHEVTFDEFVRAYLDDSPPPFARLGSQWKFVSDGDGEILVDRLFDYSRLDLLDDFLHRKLGRGYKTPSLNQSPQVDLRVTAATEADLREKCSNDFSLYQAVADRTSCNIA